MLGIVHMEDLNPIEAEGLQALVQRSTGTGSVEAIGFRISIELGRDYEPLGKPSALADDVSNSLFAASKSVDPRSVEKIGWAIKDRSHRFFGAFLVNTVAVGVGHIGQGRRPEADVGHEKIRSA
jgi:hypothetical protein